MCFILLLFLWFCLSLDLFLLQQEKRKISFISNALDETEGKRKKWVEKKKAESDKKREWKQEKI